METAKCSGYKRREFSDTIIEPANTFTPEDFSEEQRMIAADLPRISG